MSGESVVLICAKDPMIAALLGLFTELAHRTPAFPRSDERPEDALQRVKPLVVVVLDSALDAARSDLFFAQAAKRRVGVVIIGDGDRNSTVAGIAEPRGIPWLELPADFHEFRAVLEVGTASEWWRRGPDRRQQQRGVRVTPRTDRSDGEALAFVDDHGRRWFVYDRRSFERRRGERRGADGPDATSPDVRIFIGEDGERRAYPLQAGEADDVSDASLAGQLRRSTRA
jgi:hypothetical protein